MKTIKVLQNICVSFLLFLVFTGGILAGVNIYYFFVEGIYIDDPGQVSLILIFLALVLVSLYSFIRLYRIWDLGWK